MDFFPFLQEKIPKLLKEFKESFDEWGDFCISILYFIGTILVLGFGCLFAYCIIDQRRLSIIAFSFSCLMLLGFFILEVIAFFLFKDFHCCSKKDLSKAEDSDIDNIEHNFKDEEIIDDAEDKKTSEDIANIVNKIEETKEEPKEEPKEDEKEEQLLKDKDKESETDELLNTLSIFMMGALEGMFSRDRSDSKCKCCFKQYKIILSAIIILLNLYSIIYPLVVGDVSIGWFFLLLFTKIVFAFRILSINIVDSLLNIKEIMSSFKQFKVKVCYWISIALYIILIVLLICIYVYFAITSYPDIDNAVFIEDNEIWYKVNDTQAYHPEGFCYITSKTDGSLKTEDFAILSTLPRLYDVTKDGKCFIKPSKRGLFNSTMKYVFGKDYENQGIKIYCKKLAHYPTLILTSDKILNSTLSYYSNEMNLTMIENENEEEIINNNYFEKSEIKETEKGKLLLYMYKMCVSKKGVQNCEKEWDNFTQYYWPNAYTDSYEDIPGFERYQITIDPDSVFQPSFSINGKLMAGTHYIIGGGFEDSWGFGCLIETLGRKYVPQLFDNIIPFYSLVRSLARDIFIRLDSYNRKLVYVERILSREMTALSELYTQFNFSHEALFTIGHSISGTAQKSLSYFTDINGIAFDSSLGENLGDFDAADEFERSEDANNQIANVYSTGCILTGNDEDCPVNGALPKRYYNPSVYDSACLTVISCSETKKYVPMCRQVLTQNSRDPEKEFQKSMDAFYDHYGLN